MGFGHLQRQSSAGVGSWACTVDVLYNLLCRNESAIKPLALRAQEVVAQYAAKGRESEIDHIPAAEFAAPKSIDFTHGRYLCIDGLYYAYLLIPSDGYKTQVPAGWLSLIVNAGDGIDMDMFLSRQPKERIIQRVGQQLRINRSKIKDASDTNTDFDDIDGAIRSGYFLKEGLANNEDFYYLNLLITVTAPTEEDLEWKVSEMKKLLLSQDNLVHPALELAVDDDYIRKNPSKGVYRSLKSEGSGKPAKTRIALTKEQQKNFLRFISKSPMYSHWLPVMVVLLGTGLRVGECTGLTKNDVDLENSTISVNHNLIYRVIDGKAGFHITTPKTASGTRTIPILYPEVAEQLRALIEVMDALYPEDLVMNGYHGFLFRNRSGYFLSAHNINRAIERISIAYNAEEMDQAELEDREPSLLPHFSVHNLRHTFCTRLCESTNDIKFIQQVMGHADFSTTMDIYTHITQENMKEKAEVIKGNLVLM